MVSKAWNSVVGVTMAFLVLNASAETNHVEDVAASETNHVASAAASTTNSTASTDAEAVPVEQVKPEKRDKFDFIIGGGLVVAPEYSDYVDDVYEAAGYINTDDAGGWLDLYVGLEYRPVSRIGIIVGGDLWVNGGVDVSSGPLDETYANYIFIPSIYGQLYITSWLYINGGVNFPMPDTGSKYFEFESDGTGFGANIGIEIADIVRIEGGYVHVPVTAKATSKNTAIPAFEDDYNFGGAQLRILLAF